MRKNGVLSFVATVALFFLAMTTFPGCDLFGAGKGYIVSKGYTEYISTVPPFDSENPVYASYYIVGGTIYSDVKADCVLMVRSASSMDDLIAAESLGTIMNDSNSFEYRFGTSRYLAFAFWDKEDAALAGKSFSPRNCHRGVILVTPNASSQPYFEFGGSRVTGSVNIAQSGKIKVKATTAGAEVFIIWRSGDSYSVPTQAEFSGAIYHAINEVETIVDFNGKTVGRLYAAERDVGKDMSIGGDNYITLYRNDTVVAPPVTERNYTVVYSLKPGKPTGARIYHTYISKIIEGTGTTTSVVYDKVISNVSLSPGHYEQNAVTEGLNEWATVNGSENYTTTIGGTLIKDVVSTPYGYQNIFTVKNDYTVVSGRVDL